MGCGRPPPQPPGPIAWSVRPQHVTLAIHGPLRRVDARWMYRCFAALLEHCGARFVIFDAGGLTEADVGTVDVLARLQLTAGRLGREFRLEHTPLRLRELIALTGLEDALLRVEVSGLETRRQAEQGEEPLGVEEGVQPDDLPV